jgi:hypothetical protein
MTRKKLRYSLKAHGCVCIGSATRYDPNRLERQLLRLQNIPDSVPLKSQTDAPVLTRFAGGSTFAAALPPTSTAAQPGLDIEALILPQDPQRITL